jgi:hypothetical protein
MPFVDRTHSEFKWTSRPDGDTMAYMWQVGGGVVVDAVGVVVDAVGVVVDVAGVVVDAVGVVVDVAGVVVAL